MIFETHFRGTVNKKNSIISDSLHFPVSIFILVCNFSLWFTKVFLLTILTILLLCITQFRAGIYLNRGLAASYLVHIVTQSIKFYTFHCYISKGTDVSTGWLINPWSNIPKNERFLLSAGFTPKFELVVVLTQENVRGFFSKSRETA